MNKASFNTCVAAARALANDTAAILANELYTTKKSLCPHCPRELELTDQITSNFTKTIKFKNHSLPSSGMHQNEISKDFSGGIV